MTGKVTDRLGLAATGLTTSGWSAHQLRLWLDRVREGRLDPVESAATVLLVYRVWLVGLFLKALGSGWDVAWHFRWLRDDFAPPHNVNLVGDGVIIALILFHWYTRFGVDRTALRLMVGGIVLFVGSAPVDVINHRLNGLDITSWSITHFGLYTGTGIAIAGAIRGWRLHAGALSSRSFILGALWFFFLENVMFPNQHQEYGVEEIASWDRGEVYAEPSLLEFAAAQLGKPVDRTALVHFALPVPAWVYPVWMVAAAALTLVLARRSVGLRWTATTVAFAYVAWRSILWPILWATGFPTSAVPVLILLVGLAVDLVCLVARGWIISAVLGAVTVTAVAYLGGFVQSYLLVAPPINYWSAPAAAAVLGVCWLAANYLIDRRQRHLF
ncbi:MAG TPA: hypothetical protein VF163_15335 [Micromonosporaceae bacterium]